MILKSIKKIDFLILIPALLLSLVGLLVIYSISFENDSSYFVRQFFYIIFSVLVYLFIINISFKNLLGISPILYLTILIVISLTLFIGFESRGAVRWLDIGFITIQGTELAKPLLLLFWVNVLTKNYSDFIKFIVTFISVLIPIILISLQPDLSNAVILFLSWIFVLFIGGISMVLLVGFGFLVLMTIPLFWLFFLQDYQKSRILTFINPNIDPLGASYNVVQAIIALGSGQLFGRGLGQGTQSQLNFLPEGRTDFILAVVGEQLGFIGIGLVVFIFAFLIIRILIKADFKRKMYQGVFLYGSVFLLLIQFFINSAMNLGIFPVSGITLPFISYGGSSILSLFILLSLVNSATSDDKST